MMLSEKFLIRLTLGYYSPDFDVFVVFIVMLTFDEDYLIGFDFSWRLHNNAEIKRMLRVGLS
jgi:hypothetical protein